MTFLARPQSVPLGYRRSLALYHVVPVRRLQRPGGVLAEHDSADEVVLALRVLVPDGHYDAAGGQGFRGHVEADRFVEHRIDGVLFNRCLPRLQGTISEAEGHFDERI